MESKCPKCSKVTEHEDYLFEVHCADCGTRYNPFFESTPQTESVSPELGDAPLAENLYKESANAFSDIVSFGENLNAPVEETAEPPKAPETSEVSQSRPKAPVEASPGSALVTAGDSLEGYRVNRYFPPQSTWMDCDPNASDPLALGIEALWQKCALLGANAVVAMQWRFSPDGSRILISGTPVYCDPI